VAKLIYAMLASLDGYVADATGAFGWAMPDAEVHGFVNEVMRSSGTHLYGRRMYEVMSVWETLRDQPGLSEAEQEFAAIWHDADKVVYSRTLAEVATARTRLERDWVPAAIRQMKDGADRDVTVSGPELASAALAAGLVDEIHLFLFPVSVGSGKPALPKDRRLDLELVDQRRFGSGTVYLRYRTTA
jgi:dihydrofolate reductase